MDGFVRRSGVEKENTSSSSVVDGPPTKRRSGRKQDFLTTATIEFEAANKDVGQAIIGEQKDCLENVVQFFDLVKETDNIKGELQQLQFPTPFPSKELRLIELDKTLVKEFQEGQTLVFRGAQDDMVVLCSEGRTYTAKEVETSNSLLIVPRLALAGDVAEGDKHLVVREVSSVLHHYLELKPVECVSTYRVRELLHGRELRWEWAEEEKGGVDRVYSFSELLDRVQMSEGEMRTALEQMPVIEHHGSLRWLSHSLRDRMLNVVCEALDDDDNAVSLDAFSFPAMRAVLPDNVTDDAIRWMMRSMCEPVEGSDTVYRFVPRSLVRARASQLLRAAVRYECSQFERLMRQMLPEGCEMSYDQLTGLCLQSEHFQTGKTIQYLNVEDLPEDPKERLRVLFSKKDSWTMDEVSPFLGDICANAKAMSGMMVAHCRSTTSPNGEKVFCSLRVV